MLSGEKRVAFAYMEPKNQSPTEAVVKGDGLVINEFKSDVSRGHLADLLLVSVKIVKK